MLSKNKVVGKTRKALELLYDGLCDVIEHKKTKKADGSTGFSEVVVLEKQPCRLSFKTIYNTEIQNNSAALTKQAVTLFVAPELNIRAGSKVVVTQNDISTAYKSSGTPAAYSTHQEIPLELFERWA